MDEITLTLVLGELAFIHVTPAWLKPALSSDTNGILPKENHLKWCMGISLVVQWLRRHLLMQGGQVPSLVGDLRSHIPHGRKKKKRKQYCNKSIKTFKIVHIEFILMYGRNHHNTVIILQLKIKFKKL